jgi:hypothetical protein
MMMFLQVCKKLNSPLKSMRYFITALDLDPKDSNLVKVRASGGWAWMRPDRDLTARVVYSSCLCLQAAIDRLDEPDLEEDDKF